MTRTQMRDYITLLEIRIRENQDYAKYWMKCYLNIHDKWEEEMTRQGKRDES